MWRKQATISVQEEFIGKDLPAGLEDSLPADLQTMFDTVRSGVKRSAEIYINLCNMIERLAKRNEGIAAEYGRCSLLLQSVTETSADTYAADTNDVPLLNDGILATAKHLGLGQSLLEDEAKAWDEGVLEDMKRQRDCLVSVRDMFDRRDRYDKDNIPQLEKRIESNERKLSGIRSKPEGTVKPGEAEKVEEAIFKVSHLDSTSHFGTPADFCYRTSSPSSPSMPAQSSSESVSVTRFCSSRAASTTSAGCIRIGVRSVLSMQSYSRTTGGL